MTLLREAPTRPAGSLGRQLASDERLLELLRAGDDEASRRSYARTAAPSCATAGRCWDPSGPRTPCRGPS